MKKTIMCTLIMVIIFSSVTFGEDGNLNEGLSAVLIGVNDTGEILYEYNADETIEIASLTKLMTYTVAMDFIANKKASFDDMVTVGIAPTRVGGSSFDLRRGEKVKLGTLLEAILIASGNDACVAVSEYLVGSEEEFVRIMNKKADELGLESAEFINSSGMPKWKNGKKIQNLMNVKDLFALAKYVINNHPEVLEVTDKLNIDVPERKYFKENTNPLLKEIEAVDGLKTGYTDKAGYCLISTLEVSKGENNDESFRVISIAMGAESEKARKENSKKLLEYVLDNYKKDRIATKGELVSNINIDNAKIGKVDVYSNDDLVRLVNDKDKVETQVYINKDIIAPLSKGDVVGKINVFINDKKIDEIDLVVNRDVEKANFMINFFRSIQNMLIDISVEDMLVKLKLK